MTHICKGFEDSVLSQKSRFWEVGERGRTEKKKKKECLRVKGNVTT